MVDAVCFFAYGPECLVEIDECEIADLGTTVSYIAGDNLDDTRAIALKKSSF